MKSSAILVAFLVFFVVVLSLVDIGMNLLSFIPVIGDAIETTSETIIEIIQVISVIIIALIGGKK